MTLSTVQFLWFNKYDCKFQLFILSHLPAKLFVNPLKCLKIHFWNIFSNQFPAPPLTLCSSLSVYFGECVLKGFSNDSKRYTNIKSPHLVMSSPYSDGWLLPSEGIFKNQRINNRIILQHFSHKMKQPGVGLVVLESGKPHQPVLKANGHIIFISLARYKIWKLTSL